MSRTYRNPHHHNCALRHPKTTSQRREVAGLLADIKAGEYDGLKLAKVNRAHRHIVHAWDDIVVASELDKYAVK
jgi:hypothetical protein